MAIDLENHDSVAHSPSGAESTIVVPFEQRLREDWEWGMSEASIFFEGKGRVQETLRRIASKLETLSVPYAVAGGMALYVHGHERFTEDVDILVTREGLKQIHERLDGLGYVRPFAQSKNLRDVNTGVKIVFLLTGDFPGDGKPKEVAFPEPGAVAQEFHGIRFVNLPTFVTLKLASYLTGENRSKDRGDVEELVKSRGLNEDLADMLHPYVRSVYLEICRRRQGGRRFISGAPSLANETVESMLRDGVVREADGRLVTIDPTLAAKYNMWPEDEIFEG
jgi:hypothetical protein